MNYQYLTLKIEEGMAYVTLNRPDKINAMNYELFCEIDKVQKQIKKDRNIRVVILSGAGGNFSSGIDVRSMMGNSLNFAKIGMKFIPWSANLAQRVCIGWQRLPVPVIAVIEGVCFGAAMNVALGADIRYASPDAKLGIMEAKWGMLPDMAGLDTLRGLLPKDIALELIYTGDEISATKAEAYNLVTRVSDDPMAEAEIMAKKLLNTSPDAAAAIKFSTHKSWNAPTWLLLTRETIYQVSMIISKNWRIAAIRNKADKKPSFVPRQWWW
jgi:enoyl-CoA hydratase/carnithine racemase